MGYQGAQFFIDGALIHQVDLTTTPYSGTLSLPATLQNVNSSGGSSNVSLLAMLASVARLGVLETSPQYNHISTNTTVVLKYGPGVLHSIVINKFGSNNHTLTVYDNTSAAGAIIAILTMPNISSAPLALDYHGLPFNNGLTIVTATSSPGDYTIVYE